MFSYPKQIERRVAAMSRQQRVIATSMEYGSTVECCMRSELDGCRGKNKSGTMKSMGKKRRERGGQTELLRASRYSSCRARAHVSCYRARVSAEDGK